MTYQIRLTVDQLIEMKACKDGVIEFRRQFPGGVMEGTWDLTAQLFVLHSPLGQYFGWAVANGLLPMWSMRGAYLGGADLRGAYLGGADLRGADLRGAYLRGADLRGAYLGGADLRGADLRGAYLGVAYLGGADLRGADLRGAYLGGAYLGGADLRGAYLGGADLGGADLRGANGLDLAHLTGAFRFISDPPINGYAVVESRLKKAAAVVMAGG